MATQFSIGEGDRCPKCGEYNPLPKIEYTGESIAASCTRCRYTVQHPTLDGEGK